MESGETGHGVYRTEYHVVWIPKYRCRILNPGVRGYLRKLFPKILRGLLGCKVIEQTMQVDHIHTLMVIPPKYAVSAVIGQMRQYTASRLRKKFTWLGKVYWKERVVWSPGYFVSTVGLNEKQIIEYVKWQAHQDSGQAKLELF
jgi:putative transposase